MIDWIADRWDGIKLTVRILGIALTAYTLIGGAWKYSQGLDACAKLGADRRGAFANWMEHFDSDTAAAQYLAADRKLRDELPRELAKTVEGAIDMTNELNMMSLKMQIKAAPR